MSEILKTLTNVPILPINKVTVNGRLYPGPDICDYNLPDFVPLTDRCDKFGEPDSSTIGGVCKNFHFSDDYLLCDIDILDTPEGRTYLSKLNNPCAFYAAGRGCAECFGVVTNYNLCSVIGHDEEEWRIKADKLLLDMLVINAD